LFYWFGFHCGVWWQSESNNDDFARFLDLTDNYSIDHFVMLCDIFDF
jgi:hypothetical protein